MSIAQRRQALRGEIAQTRESFVRQSREVRDEVRLVIVVGSAVRLGRTLFRFLRARRRKS